MPDLVANIVTFNGDKERIKEMLLAVQNDEYGPGSISFDKIIPMPPELNIESSGRSKTDPHSDVWCSRLVRLAPGTLEQ